MGGAAEHGAGAVLQQDEIGDPHREATFRLERVADEETREVAALLRPFDHRLAGAEAPAFRHERRRRGIARRHRRRDRVLRREGQERHAEQRIGPRRVDLDPVDAVRRLDQREAQPGALAAADPLFLHHAHPFRPAVEMRQGLEQVGGIAGDAQEPLRQALLLDRRARTPAAPVNHLLIREHGLIDRIPVHPALAPLRQPGAQQIEKQFLLLPVIFRIAGREFARPVDGQAHALQLAAHGGDIVVGPAGRMDAALARGVLGGQAEGVPAHGMQHREPARALVPRHHVAERVVAHMAHVDLPARVREHFQHVVFRAAVVRHVGDGEAPARGPGLLPPGLGRGEIVRACRSLGGRRERAGKFLRRGRHHAVEPYLRRPACIGQNTRGGNRRRGQAASAG